MTVKGDLKLEIDEQGIEVRITITPDQNGAEISPESLLTTLEKKKVRDGVDREAIDRAFRTLARKKTEPVSFVAAAGTPPLPPAPETVLFEQLPIPSRLSSVLRRVLQAAERPRGFRLREEKVKTERKVLRKSSLPFLPAKEEVEVVFEKRAVREEVAIDPSVTGSGYVREGALVARVRPGKPGKEGKSVFGRLVPPPRPAQADFLFCSGISRRGADVFAEVPGFLRKGANWCDVVPFRDHVAEVAASPDGLACLLSFTPGDSAAPAPDIEEILAGTAKLGFGPASLLPATEIEAILRDAVARRTPFTGRSISPLVNGQALVTVSPDKLTAVLSLRKGRAGGRQLTFTDVNDAIRKSRVRGYRAETIRKDLRAFFDGSATELTDYVLATGRPPKAGTESKVQWRALFLPAEEADAIRAAGVANADRLKSLASLPVFPPQRVEAVARVKAGSEVLVVVPPVGSEPGVDVLGAEIPAGGNAMPDLRLFEGLALRRNVVVATEPGILEKGSDGMAILLRVRPHRDAALHVSLSPDRMKASVAFSPPEGDGARLSAEAARAMIRQAGVVRGIDEARLLSALDSVARDEPLVDHLIAEGRQPRQDAQKRIVFHVRLATGKAVTFRPDGRADFRAQDRITSIHKGELIATVRPRDPAAEDGWDVTGRIIPLPPESQETLQAGRGVREDVQPDGSVRFTSERAGELIRDGGLLSVMEVHIIDGHVDMSTGNVKFPGVVRITGSVRSGFTVAAGGTLEVGESVEGALLSAEGTITVGQGIKGEGKAIIRTRRDIQSLFAEQAALLAVGDVHLRGACVRCQVKCNGRLYLDSEKGTLVGGEVRASRGVAVQNVGSPGGLRTVISFGQDFLVKDQIEREEREVAVLEQKVINLDAELAQAPKQGPGSGAAAGAVAQLRGRKVAAMKLIDQRKLRLIALRDKYDEHVPSEVMVRGTLYPGAVLESHGRRYETRTEKRMITLHFDQTQGRIVEKR